MGCGLNFFLALGLLCVLGCQGAPLRAHLETEFPGPAWQAEADEVTVWVRRIEGASEEELPNLLQPAFECFVKEMRSFHARSAEPLARALFDRAPAYWSATALASAQRRAGHTAEAVATLKTQLERTTERGEQVALLEALSLALDAHGDEGERLDVLGQAYAQGGLDARQILAGRALFGAQYQDAVGLFGGLVDRARAAGEDPLPWALPGWGLALWEAHHGE